MLLRQAARVGLSLTQLAPTAAVTRTATVAPSRTFTGTLSGTLSGVRQLTFVRQ